MTRHERVERNVRLYPLYQAFRNALFWLPVFFLYFLSVVSLEEALLLEAIYYFAVVVAEVPSGYLADRLGRRPTLVLACAFDVAAAVTFAATGSFAPFLVAQLLKAAGHAMNSGADSALLFDSLRELGREHEVGAREGRALSLGLATTAAAALVGGVTAGVDLRIAWLLTSLTSFAALVAALYFVEPRPAGRESSAAPVAALRQVGEHLRDPVLRWVFVFVIGMVVLNHVPYEFFQPYIGLLVDDTPGDYARTPALTGVLAAVMALLGSFASRASMRVRRRMNVFPSLLLAMVLQLSIIAAMGATLAPWVGLLILLRSVPMGLLNPIVLAEIHPRVGTAVRATYLSVQSFAGRLAFGVCLVLSSRAVAGIETSHAAMAGVLGAYLIGGCALAALLALAIPRRSASSV